MIAPSLHTQKVGLLGGSFNPPHAGHREISLAAIARLGLDAVWWLVTTGNPLKDPEQYAPYPKRMAAARKIADDERIVISNFEDRRNLQYTVDTVEALIDDYPAMQFIWLMGADSLRDFHKWKNWRRIAEMVPIAVFNRPGYGDDALSSETAEALAHFRIDARAAKALTGSEPPAWVFFDETDNPLSSTALRRKAAKRNSSPS